MATTFVDVLLQVRDEFGADALAGGFIYTYSAGTTTPLATYQDLDGDTANTNPVELDSAGMAVIRQTDGIAYKWEITDADNNLLWTRDDITVGVSSSSSSQTYIVANVFDGTPGAQQFMGGHVFDRGVLFPIDFEGAQGSVETAPGSSYVVSVKRNGVEVGTITIDTGGAYTFETTGGTTVAFTAGQRMTFTGPDSGTAADFLWTISGTLT